jgi:hypothetical protein
MSFEDVVMIKTKDGSLFESAKEAENYVTDQLCADINEILKGLNLETLRYSELCKILTALAGTYKNACQLKNILDKHI